MAVDLFSLRMNIQTTGAAQAMGELRGLEAQGSKTSASLHQGTVQLDRAGSAALNGTKGFKDLSGAYAFHNAQAAQAAAATATATDAVTKKTAATGLLGMAVKQLGLWYAGFSVFSFVKHTVEAAGALHELSQRTGATVRLLSILRFAGEQSGVSAQMIAQGFRGLSMSLGQLRDGNEKAVEAFARLGLSAESFRGLSVDQAFLKVVDAMSRMEDGFGKAETAQRVFGRSGSMLLPLLEDIADRGFAAISREAAEAGAVIDGKTAKAADAFTDSLTRLKATLGGLVREILMPMLPFLTSFVEILTTAVRHIMTLATRGPVAFGLAIGMAGRRADFSDVEGGSSDSLAAPAITTSGGTSGGTSGRSSGGETAAQRQRRLLAALDASPAEALAGGGTPPSLQGPVATRSGTAGEFAGAMQPAARQMASSFTDTLRQELFVGLQRLRPFQNAFQGFFENLFAGGKVGASIKQFGSQILAGMGNIFAQMAMQAIAASPLFIALGKAMSNPFTAGFALLAFGVALKALGSAMGGTATGSGGGGGAGGFSDTVTQITLTADGAGGLMAPKAPPGNTYQVIGHEHPSAPKIIGRIVKAGNRRNV
jgi:hypothetical protein